jgi:hypothetical protein
MAKFSGTKRRPLRTNPTAPIRTTRRRTLTYEGGLGFGREPESELFLLAATNMVGEDTVYERAGDRDERFCDLVHAVTASNPAFVAGADPEAGQVGLAQYLRETMLMRSAAVVMAAEYVDKVARSVGSVGHATYGHTAVARWYDPKRHRRAVIFTDDQQHDAGHVPLDHVPLVYTFDLAGYRPSALPAGERGRYTLGGFTDATFTAMKVLEDGHNAAWPF